MDRLPLTRALMTFHHIRSLKKQRFIVDGITDLGLRGICKIGHPGVLVFVGGSDECESLAKSIKGLTWASCHLRKLTPDVERQAKPQPSWLLDETAIGCRKVKKMSEIGSEIRAAGWQEWFNEGMKQGA